MNERKLSGGANLIPAATVDAPRLASATGSMPAYKLVALDMDGTVLDENQKIPEINRYWMRRALDAGVTVMFATGRGYTSIKPYMEEMEMDTPIVAVNGGEVWKNRDELLQRKTLSLDLVLRMQALGIRHGSWYWAYATDGVYNRETWADHPARKQWLKFGYYEENPEVLEQIRAEVASWGILEISNSHPSNLELNPAGVNKATGLEEVCRMLGIDMHEIVAIGDSLNDLAMIRAAGLGVAMGNAQDLVKAQADLVTDSNVDGGVARVIRERVLLETEARG